MKNRYAEGYVVASQSIWFITSTSKGFRLELRWPKRKHYRKARYKKAAYRQLAKEEP